MNALEAILEMVREMQEKYPSPTDLIKEIQVGFELKNEMDRIASRDGPFYYGSQFCGTPIVLRPECFCLGAEVMGAIIYVDREKLPTLITRSEVSPITKGE